MIGIKDFKNISPYLWEVPQTYRSDMRVSARIYASREMLQDILGERSIEQLVNIATLPGIDKYALAMPDIHQGYGFPIGGVAALHSRDGVISPGGVGYDINCGVRLLTSAYHIDDLRKQITELTSSIQRNVPSGVGRGGNIVLKERELNEVLNTGVRWAVKNGYGSEEDLLVLEENGCYKAAEAALVSAQAKKRGRDQLGTLGAGNHFLEIQEVIEICDERAAKSFGLWQGQVNVMIHTGSRGLGHQNCTDYVRLMNRVMEKYHIDLPDRELASAPFSSPEGQHYFHAMAAAANFAWTNRQLITYEVRRAWQSVLGDSTKGQLKIVYDVAHNIAKLEQHDSKEYIIHRKGATRAFGPHHPALPKSYQETGQPVLIPGSMGTYSYVLSGTKEAMENTFGSACHGAGRRMSRTKAKKSVNYDKLKAGLKSYGVVVRGGSRQGLLEEAPEAYKDIERVVEVVHNSNIAKKVAKLKPVAIIKG